MTARILPQKGSMSTTRSFTIGMFPIAEITGTWPDSAMSTIRVLHASTAAPSMRIPHEPQIIIRQLLRYASVPSWLVLDDVEDVEQRRPVRRVDLVLLERALARDGVVAPDLQGHLHAAQYVLSCGCHFVIVTGFQSSFGAPSSHVTMVCRR